MSPALYPPFLQDNGLEHAAGKQDPEMSLDLLTWRSALWRAAAVPSFTDQMRLARLCYDAGLARSSRMLHQAACLQFGFSPSSPAQQVGREGATGVPELWRATRPKTDAGYVIRGTVERAINELQAFARAHAADLAVRLVAPCSNDGLAAAPLVGGPAFTEPNLSLILDEVFAFLRAQPSQGGCEQIEGRLAQMREFLLWPERADWRSFAGASLPLLAAATAFASLQEFCLQNSSFIVKPFSSAALLHAVARFDDAGLGPFFGNLPRVVRNSQDVFELAQLAQAAGDTAGATIGREHWVALLSVRLSGELRDEVIDDLGDIGATAALALILDQTLRLPRHRVDSALVMRIRDAALDNADYALAAKAQALSVRLFPERLLERRLLAEIYATAGLTQVAEQVFIACLEAAPGDPLIQERIAALRSGTFAQYRVVNGFGTPPDRLRTRRLRQQRAAG